MGHRFLEHQKELIDKELEEVLPDYTEDPGLDGKFPYVIEGMLPANQLHLLGGPSGGGKSTLAFQMLDALHNGTPFLGRRTRQMKIAYVSGDRPTASVEETQDRCRVAFPTFSLVDESLDTQDLVSKVIPRLTAVCGHRPNFIYVDGFTSMVPGGFQNNYAIVARWLASLQRYCWKQKITILGACHTTKTKENEKFTNPRQRILGSVSWGGFSETVLIIEPLDDDITRKKRMLYILPRNHADEHMVLTLTPEGRLQVPDKVERAESITGFVMESVLESYDPGTQVLYSGLRDLALGKGLSLRTFNRWLAKYVEQGKLVRKLKGIYVIPGSPESPAQTEAPSIQ